MDNKNEMIHTLIDLFRHFKKDLATAFSERLIGGVTVSQVVLLKHLEMGYQTVSDLAAKLAISPPGVSKLVDQLFSMDLVTRNRSVDDRRIVKLELTTKGKELLEKNEKIKLDVSKEYLGQLSEEELSTLIDILNKIVQ